MRATIYANSDAESMKAIKMAAEIFELSVKKSEHIPLSPQLSFYGYSFKNSVHISLSPQLIFVGHSLRGLGAIEDFCRRNNNPESLKGTIKERKAELAKIKRGAYVYTSDIGGSLENGIGVDAVVVRRVNLKVSKAEIIHPSYLDRAWVKLESCVFIQMSGWSKGQLDNQPTF